MAYKISAADIKYYRFSKSDIGFLEGTSFPPNARGRLNKILEAKPSYAKKIPPTLRNFVLQGKDGRGRSPFLRAVICDHPYLVQFILDSQGTYEVNLKDPTGATALHYSVLNAWDRKVTTILLANGADVNATDNRGRTPLHNIAKIKKPPFVDSTHTIMLVQRGAVVDARDADGMTLLHLASRYGNLEMASELLKAGVNIEAQDVNGATPLRLAASSGHTALVKLLLEKGAH